jgi:hypothetical protein
MRRPPNTKPRDGKRRARRTDQAASPDRRLRTVRHPQFGEIPLVPVTYVDLAGRERETFEYDPTYQPPLPKGAIRGDISKQHFCRMCHVPRYFYVDIPLTCVQCNRPFVFRAVEQKLWYETFKFHFNARATRCLRCRRQRRSDEALARQIGDAKAAVRAHPDDASAHLALAEAIARYFQRRGQGKLQEAIAASRKARRLLRNHVAHELRETFFWEGLALNLAGHVATAQEALREFISAPTVGRRQALLAKEARAMLDGAAHGRCPPSRRS